MAPHEHVYNGGNICETCGDSIGKPNTDSRELDDIILQVAYEAGLIPRGKTISADSFLEAKQALLAYTANKQRALLEWVEQEVVGVDEGSSGKCDYCGMKECCRDPGLEQDELRAAQRNQLKNKKESLS